MTRDPRITLEPHMIFFVFGLAVLASLITVAFGGRVLLVGLVPQMRFTSIFQLWCYAIGAAATAGIAYWLWTVFVANR